MQEERSNPEILLASESRAMRAAKGAGRTKTDVANLAITYSALPLLLLLLFSSVLFTMPWKGQLCRQRLA